MNMIPKTDQTGRVYLVGAGPGDPGLLTLKGKACIRKADVLIYDYLANPEFLDYARTDATRIYVGKKGGAHTMNQDAINRLIVEHAKAGHVVVRLKGGDPFIFGRGGEEAQELIKSGVTFEVVPGVTSAISVPAYAGIPLTHRDHTPTVAFITGHEDPLKGSSTVAWDRLATGAGTLVFLMGVGNLPEISERLVKNGRDEDTPVAVIERGTRTDQRTVVGTLDTIARLTKKHRIRPPAVIVVGDVVRLREELNWFENKPLFGKRIVVTRARAQASEFLHFLTDLGADCIEFPTIEIAPPETWAPVDQAIHKIDSYQWLLFTSINGVNHFLDRLYFAGKDIRDLKGIKIGAIGPATAGAWEKMGIQVDLMPQEYRAKAVVEAFKAAGVKSGRISIPRAAKAREMLPRSLENLGMAVDVVPVYRTTRPVQDRSLVEGFLEQGAVDMVTFTSSSTVTNFAGMFDDIRQDLFKWMKRVPVACIGPITAKTAEREGLSVSLIPEDYTIDALTRSVVAYFSSS
ncbi:MAG: uroporphyrinogen-III C-methyltransferase [Deltaproteobacteria bacterium]|nr:uroporphyrinogen-III C-methyltransferase [Deltaproteobacteria bacterium]